MHEGSSATLVSLNESYSSSLNQIHCATETISLSRLTIWKNTSLSFNHEAVTTVTSPCRDDQFLKIKKQRITSYLATTMLPLKTGSHVLCSSGVNCVTMGLLNGCNMSFSCLFSYFYPFHHNRIFQRGVILITVKQDEARWGRAVLDCDVIIRVRQGGISALLFNVYIKIL